MFNKKEKFKPGDIITFVAGKFTNEKALVLKTNTENVILEVLVLKSKETIKDNFYFFHAIKIPNKCLLLNNKRFSIMGDLNKLYTETLKSKIELHGGQIKQVGKYTTDIITTYPREQFAVNSFDSVVNLNKWWSPEEFWTWILEADEA